MLSRPVFLLALSALSLAIHGLKITYPDSNTTQIPISVPLEIQWTFDRFTDPGYLTIGIFCEDPPSNLTQASNHVSFEHEVSSDGNTYTFDWESFSEFHVGSECFIAFIDPNSLNALATTRDFTLVNGNASNPSSQPSSASITSPTTTGATGSKSGTLTITKTIHPSPSADYPPPFATFSVTLPDFASLQSNISVWRSTQTSWILSGISFIPTSMTTPGSTCTSEHASVMSYSMPASTSSGAASATTSVTVVTGSTTSASETSTESSSTSIARHATSGAGDYLFRLAWVCAVAMGVIDSLGFWWGR